MVYSQVVTHYECIRGGKLSAPGAVKAIVIGEHNVTIGDNVTLWNDVKLSVCGTYDKTATLTIGR